MPDIEKPKVEGPRAKSMILFTDVRIVDTPGRGPYAGDVLVEDDKITAVGHISNRRQLEQDPGVIVIQGHGTAPMF
ncbi:hypothetical protein EDB81DRAFT_914982 [Dactylonectria macrodidyma]|uniref:Uncharacterized protein n=1 Tax=Dactylonectria macrodidyma TaxID=307937 RepID=A0A9P9DEX5_9HYPO|nr:hypothetical protein EDB81DRAFT_914982 [Dactylonectria macrodidyma]